MILYIAKRIVFSVFVFAVIGFVSFFIIWLIPGDFFTPLEWMVRAFDLDPDLPAVMRAQYGVDKPMIVQWWIWFSGVILHGDFGMSFMTDGPVGPYIFRPGGPVQVSLIVSGTSLLMAWLVGIPVGVLSSLSRGRRTRTMFYLATVPWLSIPSYVIGALIHWFIYRFIDPLMVGAGLWGLCGWRYVGQPMNCAKFGSCLLHLLPIWIIVGMPIFITVVRHMRSSMHDVMEENYITVARSKGMREFRVLFRHALRNAANPLVSMFGVMLPTLLMNTIIVSTLFNIPSFAQVLLSWVSYQDQHVVTAALLFYGSFMIVGNLLADIVLVVIDPRIRYS